MTIQSPNVRTDLYNLDLARWYDATLTCLRASDWHNLDRDSLIEELEGLAARDRRELKSRLKVLLSHLLKRTYVPLPDDYRGWENTIDEQREQLQDILTQSPSLRDYFIEVFEAVWQRALNQVRKDYPQITFGDDWRFSREPEAILTQRFWS